MSPGAVLKEAWALYKRHWRHLIGVALIVYLFLSLITLVLGLVFEDWVALLASAFVSLAGTFWLQGALVEAVADVRDGRADLSISQTLERVAPRLNTLALAGMLAALGITVGVIAFVVPGLVLLTWWSLIVPVIMLEQSGVAEAFRRSRQLVSGYGWNVLGVLLLTILVLIGVSIVISTLLSPLADNIQSLVASIVSSSLTAPFAALAWTLVYYELRARKEPEGSPALSADL